MIEELIFTSSERGLQIGKSGFCTVASTPEMASNLTRMLESLSGYRHLFTPGSPDAVKNPVVYSFLQIKVGGEQKQVLSRVADAGIDYSGRSNKLAHHISLPRKFLKNSSPTRILLDRHFFCKYWEGDPKQLQPRPLLNKASDPSPCDTWEKITGDAGWAGELVEACQRGKIIYLIIQPSTPAAAMLHEALSLLPQQKQWQTTFSTFYRRLPPNVQCQIRCVMDGSPEIEMTRQNHNNIVWDLTKPLGTPFSVLADFARHGKLITGNEISTPAEIEEKVARADNVAATPTPTRPRKKLKENRLPPELPGGVVDVSDKEARDRFGWLKLLAGALVLLIVAATFAILFIPGLKEQAHSIVSPKLPPDIVRPLNNDPVDLPDPIVDEPPVEPEQVFTHIAPPMVLSPPIVKIPEPAPVQPSPPKITATLLSAKDISFSPNWQAFQKSRFPQPVLLIQHSEPITNSIELNFSGDAGELQMTPADEHWNISDAGRQIGEIRRAKHEQGTQLEFQCNLDDTGTPKVFLDSLDLLNKSVIELRTQSLPATEFNLGLQFVHAHVDFDNISKQQKLAFGIGGEALMQTLTEGDVELRLLKTNSPRAFAASKAFIEKIDETIDPNKEELVEFDEADGEADRSEVSIEFPIRFDQEAFDDLTKSQRKRLNSLGVTVNQRIFKSAKKPLLYQWRSFTFVVADKTITARSWNFEHHPIDVITRELRKQLKAMNGKKKKAKANLAAKKQELEKLLKVFDDAKTRTSGSLKLSQLLPDRLASPIEFKTSKGPIYLVFIDMGKASRLWSPREMRMSYHGAIGSESN